ncbi:MAG: hypothetical protein WKF34_00655 [Pyrinomonadaceae bacterium]
MRRKALTLLTAAFSLTLAANAGFAQPDTIYRLPAGTRIKLTLDAELSSRVATANDTFIASVNAPVRIRDEVMVPVGTQIAARVVAVERAATRGHDGRLELVFETLTISGKPRPIAASISVEGRDETRRRFTVLSIFGGLAAGAAVGAARSPRGARIGSGIGAASGTAIALLRKGKDARLGKGEEFEIELKKDVVLPVLDY